MPGEASTLISDLPPWLQWSASAALFVVTTTAGLFAIRTGKRRREAEDSEGGDVEHLLESSAIKRLLAAIEETAANAKLQTEAVKTISAAATAIAKTVEEDFDERRVLREVERRLALDRAGRQSRPDVPAGGWGA